MFDLLKDRHENKNLWKANRKDIRNIDQRAWDLIGDYEEMAFDIRGTESPVGWRAERESLNG